MRLTGAAALAVLLVLPALLGSYAITLFIFIFFYAFLGQAWNIVGGYAGQLSAGHAAFVGVGAYTSAMLSMHAGITPWLGMLVGGAVSACLGAVIGFLGFRFGLRGFYFVLLTVAFAEICRIVALNTEAVGGALGLYITFTGDPRQFQFQDNRAYYYVALGLMLAATAIAAWIERHRIGAYLAAIREDEDASEALGVDTFRCKMLAMIVSSFLTGVGGTFYAYYLFSLQPNAVFGIPLSVEIVIRPVVGGAGTLLGPILGSFILTPLAEVSRAYFQAGGWSGAHLVVYGALLIAVVLFVPEGAYPFLLRRLRARRSLSKGAAPPPTHPRRREWAGAAGARTRGVHRWRSLRRPNAGARRTPVRPGSSERLLVVSGLSKRFGGLLAVSDLSLELAAGEVLGLIGPNGAGKTTAFNLISGFLAPDAGDVRLDGRSIVGRKPHAVCRAGLARTFQIVRPFPHLSVLDNVKVGALARLADVRAAVERARQVIGQVGLEAKTDAAAAGLTLAERKRLELARALATAPRLLLLDEVMAGLNPTETAAMIGLVRSINASGISILLIEHNMRAVMSLSHRIAVLSFGQKIAEGPPAVVASHPKVVEAYLGEAYAEPPAR